MRWLLSSTVVLFLLYDTFAVNCHDRLHGNTTGTCTGDYCWTAVLDGRLKPMNQGCLNGRAIDYINGRCWPDDNSHLQYSCVCE
ncbi:hypothetical protein PMAYCL1PPCAC_27293, partial [Pristionchus mayeri]